jgi:hypothetical protein
VIKGVLNPKEIDVLFGTESTNFRIQNIWLEEHLPLQTPGAKHGAAQKLIDAALKLDPSLFNHGMESSSKQGLVIVLQCEQSNDLAEGCQIATKLGDEIRFKIRKEDTENDMLARYAEIKRAGLANVFQILFAQTIVANFSKAKVTASTVFESLPHPAKNPSLLVHIVLPNSKQNSDYSYELIARCLSQSAAKLNSELSK